MTSRKKPSGERPGREWGHCGVSRWCTWRCLEASGSTRSLRGIIKTPMHPVEFHETYAGLHPVGRMGETSDIVDAVVFLESAPFVTGEILHVDGGQNAGH